MRYKDIVLAVLREHRKFNSISDLVEEVAKRVGKNPKAIYSTIRSVVLELARKGIVKLERKGKRITSAISVEYVGEEWEEIVPIKESFVDVVFVNKNVIKDVIDNLLEKEPKSRNLVLLVDYKMKPLALVDPVNFRVYDVIDATGREIVVGICKHLGIPVI